MADTDTYEIPDFLGKEIGMFPTHQPEFRTTLFFDMNVSMGIEYLNDTFITLKMLGVEIDSETLYYWYKYAKQERATQRRGV